MLIYCYKNVGLLILNKKARNIMKRHYFEVKMRIGDFYSGDGKIVVEDNVFE